MKKKKPILIQCMKCKHYRGLHELLTKVKCNFKPTSDDMRHRTIEDNNIIDCPMLKFGLDWRNAIKSIK
jgi:hypothetical protein